MKCDLLKPYKDFFELKDEGFLGMFGFIATTILVFLLVVLFIKWESPSGSFIRFLVVLITIALLPIIKHYVKECRK